MKKIIISVFIAFCMTCGGIAFAQEPDRISAEQAFDAYQYQIDPISGEAKSVALIDVRSRAEYFWVGTACQVDEIITAKGESVVPDRGKVTLLRNGRFIRFELNGRWKFLQVRKVDEIVLSPIAINIPFRYWDEFKGGFIKNNNFANEIEALADEGVEVLIFFCRSGGRSQACVDPGFPGRFHAIYEIDTEDGGVGGFEGTSYSNVYNGYRGFPRRLTEIQEDPSVSWKDAGLPMKTSIKLEPIDNPSCSP